MQIKDVNFWQTYAPVVRWSSLRFLLTLACIKQYATRQIDFTLAFPQAYCDTDVWCELPKLYAELGFLPEGANPNDYALKLIRNCYGLRQAAKNFYDYLKTWLLNEAGFTMSQSDPCVFYRGTLIFAVYVDDTIIFAPNSSEIDKFLKDLGTKFEFTEESTDVAAYLGIKCSRSPSNTSFELSQPYLIKKIIEQVGFYNESKRHDTPVNLDEPPLTTDPDGDPMKASWAYRSVLGKLNYLTCCSRPDLSYSVHQCARFSINPKMVHERAVKRIVRYLMSTTDRGIIYEPDSTKGLECFVDADFIGNWRPGSTDRSNCLSRTGYVITYASCPLIWASKLQTEIALSSTEAEYIALSTALREVIPLMKLEEELQTIWNLKKFLPQVIVHEDNQSCISIATNDQFRPRTRHIAIKYHHFRDYVDSKRISVQYIKTDDQPADILTKGLAREKFQYLRKKLQGW
jgi:hypothetical protein